VVSGACIPASGNVLVAEDDPGIFQHSLLFGGVAQGLFLAELQLRFHQTQGIIDAGEVVGDHLLNPRVRGQERVGFNEFPCSCNCNAHIFFDSVVSTKSAPSYAF